MLQGVSHRHISDHLSELLELGLTSLSKRFRDWFRPSDVLQGVSHRHISDHLSELGERVLVKLMLNTLLIAPRARP